MVKNTQKSSSKSIKKKATKTKPEEKLTNGTGEHKNEKTETKVIEDETAVEEMDAAENKDKDSSSKTQKNENIQVEDKSVEKGESSEIKNIASDTATSRTSRKRKAAVETKEKKKTTQTKSKKQKVLLDVPKISSVSGKLFVIGDNTVGQLGLSEDITEKKRPALVEDLPAIVDIAAGAMHSACLTENGEVMTFGCNDEGALGRTTTEEGSEFIPRKVDIPERIVQISAGDSHSAALSESGQVYIWGNFRNNNGPMGLIAENAIQAAPTRILNNITIVKIASGSDHFICLSNEGVVYTCGNGEAGQLGRVSEHSSVNGGRRGRATLLTPDAVQVTRPSKPCFVNNIWTGSFATFLNIQQNGLVYAFGLNNHSQLGLNNENIVIWKPQQIESFNGKTWTQINGGQHHTLALDNDGVVYSLGRSEYGRLGLGEGEEAAKPTAIPSLTGQKCTEISSGNCVSFALGDNGSAYSWGMGTNYQLGHGNEDDQHIPQPIKSKVFDSWKAFKISGGGQHTLILAHPQNSSEKSQ